VPQQDWDDLRDQSLMRKEDELEVRRLVEMLNPQLEAIVQ
jgi:hypothetical protein